MSGNVTAQPQQLQLRHMTNVLQLPQVNNHSRHRRVLLTARGSMPRHSCISLHQQHSNL
jgi:hypothetical protein